MAAEAAAKLEVDRVCKRYGSFTALQETSLKLREGEFLTLLGPSGSGKTTLLMMVAGLVSPDGGRIVIDGKDATDAPPFRRDIGMVFQSYALFPHMTVAENIAFPLRMRRRKERDIRAEVARVLDLVQLPHLAGRMPRQLSGGQQQRIALARCLVYGPSIILMDEPLGALDKKLRDQLQIEIKRLHRQLGTTMLYVTHDQGETLTMSDRVCLMNHGRIEQLGTPADLYFRPRTVFAADFLGDSNLLEGQVLGPAGEGRVAVACSALGKNLLVDGIAAPGACRVMLRPESLSLRQEGGGEDAGCNAVTGEVRDVIFTGNVTRTMVQTPGGALLSVAGLTVEAALSLRPGAPVRVHWRPDAAVLLPLPA